MQAYVQAYIKPQHSLYLSEIFRVVLVGPLFLKVTIDRKAYFTGVCEYCSAEFQALSHLFQVVTQENVLHVSVSQFSLLHVLSG